MPICSLNAEQNSFYYLFISTNSVYHKAHTPSTPGAVSHTSAPGRSSSLHLPVFFTCTVSSMIQLLETDEIRTLFHRKWYPEALYLLAMLDYLSRENNIPVCTKYDDIRTRRLEKPVYPTGILITSEVLQSEAPLRQAELEAIPEFRRFNIMESEVRNVV